MTQQAIDGLQIIIAWTVEDVEVVRSRRRDLGERPELRHIKVARTALWLNSGTTEDVQKAEAYARREGYAVFTYPQSVKDARAEAARGVLESA